MGFFDRFRKKPDGPSPKVIDQFLRQELVDLVLSVLRDKNGQIRVEDAISAMATIVAERCIDAAGDYPLRNHKLAPGSSAFSTNANIIICGDVLDLNQMPETCIVGILCRRLDKQTYSDAEFPSIEQVMKVYASGVGNAANWGKVPLSVPEANRPFIPPLQAGYQTRARVDEILKPVLADKQGCVRIATESLADILKMVASSIDHKIALTLAIETVNGMAKTAPMTEEAMQAAQQRASQ